MRGSRALANKPLGRLTSAKESEVAFLGDDFPGLAIMQRVGRAVVIHNAHRVASPTSHCCHARSCALDDNPEPCGVKDIQRSRFLASAYFTCYTYSTCFTWGTCCKSGGCYEAKCHHQSGPSNDSQGEDRCGPAGHFHQRTAGAAT